MSAKEPTLRDVVLTIGGGNPGAIEVLVRISERDDREALLTELIRKELTGSAIWMLYRDDYREDFEAMCEGLKREAS